MKKIVSLVLAVVVAALSMFAFASCAPAAKGDMEKLAALAESLRML